MSEGKESFTSRDTLATTPRKPAGHRGTYGRRIIRTIIKGGRIHEYHATKGWRSYRRGQ